LTTGYGHFFFIHSSTNPGKENVIGSGLGILVFSGVFVIAVLVVSSTLLRGNQSVTVQPWDTSIREWLIFQYPTP
jgi:threonine/homoserine/homoserine lactone efflux protein